MAQAKIEDRQQVYIRDRFKPLWIKLEQEGKKKDRSLSYLVNKAIAEYLERRNYDV